jgi:hypothetical protein
MWIHKRWKTRPPASRRSIIDEYPPSYDLRTILCFETDLKRSWMPNDKKNCRCRLGHDLCGQSVASSFNRSSRTDSPAKRIPRRGGPQRCHGARPVLG